MARRNRNRSRQDSLLVARPTPTHRKALDHTATSFRESLSDYPRAMTPDEIRGLFRGTVRTPLIRTVLENSSPPPARPRMRGQPSSPVLRVRATMRSSDGKTRSPYLNATTVTPQLTERAIKCAQRTIRREVLFATKRTGKGAKSPRRPRSKVRC